MSWVEEKYLKTKVLETYFYDCHMGPKLLYGCQVALFFHNNLQQKVTMFPHSQVLSRIHPTLKKNQLPQNNFDINIYIRITQFALYNRLFTGYYACQRWLKYLSHFVFCRIMKYVKYKLNCAAGSCPPPW